MFFLFESNVFSNFVYKLYYKWKELTNQAEESVETNMVLENACHQRVVEQCWEDEERKVVKDWLFSTQIVKY